MKFKETISSLTLLLTGIYIAGCILTGAFSTGGISLGAGEPSSKPFSVDEENLYFNSILTDWEKQESHYHRNLSSKEALTELKKRAELLLEQLISEELILPEQGQELESKLAKLRALDFGKMTSMERLIQYIELRWALRRCAMKNDLLADKPILFMQGNRFVCQMLHEYLSYFYQYTGRNGGGIRILKKPGYSFETESLTEGKFAKGVFSTLSLSYDAKTIYFAYADFSQLQKEGAPVLSTDEIRGKGYNPKYNSEYIKEEKGKYHLFKMDLADGKVTQLTKGTSDDFDPIPLPDGALAFLSLRRGGFGRCHGDWEPLPVHTLHRLNPNGEIACLSWHETNEWHPSMMKDGRILYTRWDYVDRSASHHHGLWITNPDGTGAVSLFGNYTYKLNACYQAKEIPNSKKIMFIAGAHHLNVGGSLMILDPTQVKYDPVTSEDLTDALECLSPELPNPETPNQCPPQYYFSPLPLSEDYYLVSYSHDPLGGMLSREYSGTTGKLGIYYKDRFGNMELLYEDSQYSCMYPMPLCERPIPFAMPSQLPDKKEKKTTGTLFLSNVNEALTPLPKDRPIKELRVFQIFPKGPDHRSNVPRIGHANAENARAFLGTVPVEKDGSAHFTVPANVPLYFQGVDANGRAVQSMRSAVYLQPGENRGCVGCHEQAQTTLKNEQQKSIAHSRPVSLLKNDLPGTAPFSYPILIQPLLDKACISCHSDKKEAQAKPVLTGTVQAPFTLSYQNLKPYLRWYEWGGSTIRETSTLPGQCGADSSPLANILNDKTHKKLLSDKEKQIFMLWMDANAPFYGRPDPEGCQQQLKGATVPFPVLQ